MPALQNTLWVGAVDATTKVFKDTPTGLTFRYLNGSGPGQYAFVSICRFGGAENKASCCQGQDNNCDGKVRRGWGRGRRERPAIEQPCPPLVMSMSNPAHHWSCGMWDVEFQVHTHTAVHPSNRMLTDLTRRTLSAQAGAADLACANWMSQCFPQCSLTSTAPYTCGNSQYGQCTCPSPYTCVGGICMVSAGRGSDMLPLCAEKHSMAVARIMPRG